MSYKTNAIANRLTKSVGWYKQFYMGTNRQSVKSQQNSLRNFLLCRYFFGRKKMRIFYFAFISVFFSSCLPINKYRWPLYKNCISCVVQAGIYILARRPNFEFEELLCENSWDDVYRKQAAQLFKYFDEQTFLKIVIKSRLPRYRPLSAWFFNEFSVLSVWNNFVKSQDNFMWVLAKYVAKALQVIKKKFHPQRLQYKDYSLFLHTQSPIDCLQFKIYNYIFLFICFLYKKQLSVLFLKFFVPRSVLNFKWPERSLAKNFFDKFNYKAYLSVVSKYKKHRHFKNSSRILCLLGEFREPNLLTEHVAFELTKKKKHSAIVWGIRQMLHSSLFCEQFIFKVISVCIAGKLNGKPRTKKTFIKYGEPPSLGQVMLPLSTVFGFGGARTGVFGVRTISQLD